MLMAVDIGTTGTKAVVFDLKGNIKGMGYFDTPTYFPRPGFVEQETSEVVELLYSSTKYAVQNSGVDPKDIIGISSWSQIMD